MEFDKNRIYTAVNADELKVGSLVIYADTMEDLKSNISADGEDTFEPKAIQDIFDEGRERRFQINGLSWALVYFVSEPEEKVLKWTDLKIGDVIKHKKDGEYRMIVGLSTDHEYEHVIVGDGWMTDEYLESWEKVENV